MPNNITTILLTSRSHPVGGTSSNGTSNLACNVNEPYPPPPLAHQVVILQPIWCTMAIVSRL